MAGAVRAKVHYPRMRMILFWAQEGRCYHCRKSMPHPADRTNPLRTPALFCVQQETGNWGDGSRTGSLLGHQMCARLPTQNRGDNLAYLSFVKSRILKFRGWSWAEIEGYLREQPCFLRFALAAHLRGTENPHAHYERPAPGSEVSSDA